MRIAIPLASGRLCMHFGHCEQFALIEADPSSGSIVSSRTVTPPPHEPGVLPRWLAEQKVNVVLAGGMGNRARQMLEQQGVTVIVGAPDGTPEEHVAAYLANTLEAGDNVCDH